MVTGLAVKVVHITSPHIEALAEQEVQALKAVLGTKHILQYVHHLWTAARDMLVLSTRCVMLFVILRFKCQCVAPYMLTDTAIQQVMTAHATAETSS